VLDRNLSLIEADLAWLSRRIAQLEREADHRAARPTSPGARPKGGTRRSERR
jgi:hypothetical protein